ncbi:uncharacterized protein P884DRAFT_116381 [Thermothelomyces heterothallicus CBS 202.75]|uniref:uncharacterized protein n=1 Tax=Thermothelomyces heterothallicus CBS 202.75 TaxID=1149848 RepID=UPI0037447F43
MMHSVQGTCAGQRYCRAGSTPLIDWNLPYLKLHAPISPPPSPNLRLLARSPNHHLAARFPACPSPPLSCHHRRSAGVPSHYFPAVGVADLLAPPKQNGTGAQYRPNLAIHLANCRSCLDQPLLIAHTAPHLRISHPSFISASLARCWAPSSTNCPCRCCHLAGPSSFLAAPALAISLDTF